MKKILLLAALFLSGCTGDFSSRMSSQPAIEKSHYDLQKTSTLSMLGVRQTMLLEHPKESKKGMSVCKSWVWLIASGDCSIEAASKKVRSRMSPPLNLNMPHSCFSFIRNTEPL